MKSRYFRDGTLRQQNMILWPFWLNYMRASGTCVASLQLVEDGYCFESFLHVTHFSLTPLAAIQFFDSFQILFACKALKCLVPGCISELLHPNTPSRWIRSVELLLAVPLHVRQAYSLSHVIVKVFFKQTSYLNFFGFLWIWCIYTHFLSFLCGQCILSVLSLNSLFYLFFFF